MKTIFKTHGVVHPNETHQIVAANGVFLSLQSDWINAVVPTPERLLVQLPEYKLNIPLPGREIFAPVVRFFAQIYRLHHSEAAVLLHFNMAEQTWAFTVPVQTASMAHVHYDMTDRLPGYRCVGTMHSHGHMSASHSAVDTRDEMAFDGLHITIGGLTKYPDFDMDAELVVREHRFKLKPEDFPGITQTENTVARWNNRCVLAGFAEEADENVPLELLVKVETPDWHRGTAFSRLFGPTRSRMDIPQVPAGIERVTLPEVGPDMPVPVVGDKE